VRGHERMDGIEPRRRGACSTSSKGRRLTAEARNGQPRHALISEGSSAEEMYLVETGRFTVERDGVNLAEIGAGSVIGEIAFLTGGARTADVIAARNSVVLRIDRRAYDLLCATTPGLQQAIAAELAGRLAETSARVVPDPGRPRARTICLVPSAGAPLPPRFAPDLASEMGTAGDRAPDHRGRFQARLGDQRRPRGRRRARLAERAGTHGRHRPFRRRGRGGCLVARRAAPGRSRRLRGAGPCGRRLRPRWRPRARPDPADAAAPCADPSRTGCSGRAARPIG
jgi:CRP-like cAMP-binding protein